MLSLTTTRHRLVVHLPGIYGTSEDNYTGLSNAIDAAADRLLQLVQQDHPLLAKISSCTSRLEGYQYITQHLKAATPDAAWLRERVATGLCEFVLSFLRPHIDQQLLAVRAQTKEARTVMARFGYTVPAAITETVLATGKRSYGFRFVPGATIGQHLNNDDHTTATVLSVVHPA